MSEDVLVQFERKGAITVGFIETGSVIDAINVAQFGGEILGYVEAHPGVHLLLDFRHVGYLSSAVLTELLKIDDACKQGTGSLRLCSLSKDIRKVFEITNLDKHFIIYDDAEKGVKQHKRSLDVAAEERAWDKGGDT